MLSDSNRKATRVLWGVADPDHSDRFRRKCPQPLCRDALTGRCYWEVQRQGGVHVSVSYRGIRRGGDHTDCEFGWSDQSWSLECSEEDGFSVCHQCNKNHISSPVSSKVAVCWHSVLLQRLL